MSEARSTVIETFADWITSQPDRYSAAVQRTAKVAVLDTIGCAVLGAQTPPAQSALKAVAGWGRGPSVVIGSDVKVPPPVAALVNATAAHALDFDDWDIPANSHPSAVLVPALLALTDSTGASGADLIDAYIIGLEVIVRFGEAVNMDHFDRGWHTTATLCVFGAAAASARALRLSRDEIASALGIATSMSAGNNCQIGTMTKPLHAGFSAKNGIIGASLAQAGMTASRRAIEGGFLKSHCGPGAPGFGPVLAKLGDRLAIEEHGLVLKRYPSCGYTHRAVDGLLDLRAREGFRAKDIASIQIRMPEHFGTALRYRIPTDEREALFSMPYCIAAAAVDGALNARHFTPEAIRYRDVLDLAERVTVETYPSSDSNVNMGPSAPDTVTVRLHNGSAFELVVDFPIGAPARPASQGDVESKFRTCAAMLPSSQREKILDLVWRLDTLPSSRELTGQLGEIPRSSVRRGTRDLATIKIAANP